MKKQFLYLFPLCLAAVFCLLFSCSKRDQSNVSTSPKFPEIQSWFNTTISTTYASTETKVLQGKVQSKKLLWENGKSYALDSATIYQIPFFSKSVKAYDLVESANPVLPLSIHDKVGYKYVVFTKYKNDHISFAVMTVNADPTYLDKHNNSLEGINYRNVPQDFSGQILFHTWDDRFICGWRYNNGKVAGKIAWVPSGRQVTTEATCQTYSIVQWCQDCTDYYTNGEYTHTVCQEPFNCGTQLVTICSEGEYEPGGPGGSDPGGYPQYELNSELVLCPTNLFAMKKVGNAWVGRVTGVRVGFKRPSTGENLIFNFDPFCVTIPAYTVEASGASNVFRDAVNLAAMATATEMNEGLSGNFAIRDFFRAKLTYYMNWEVTGSSYSIGDATCGSGIPSTAAKYGTECR